MFKNNQYYIEKTKYYLGIIATAFIAVAFLSAMVVIA